jgi:hypothetical protein
MIRAVDIRDELARVPFLHGRGKESHHEAVERGSEESTGE